MATFTTLMKLMMGVICASMIVTRADRHGRGKAVQPGNREWATAINCISGDGFDVPPFLLVQVPITCPVGIQKAVFPRPGLSSRLPMGGLTMRRV